MHLAATFSDDAHDFWMGYGGSDLEGTLVESLQRAPCQRKRQLVASIILQDRQGVERADVDVDVDVDVDGDGDMDMDGTYLEPLVVARLGIHEDFQRVYLKQISAFARVVGAVVQLTGLVQLAKLVGQATIIFLIKPQSGQLGVCLEP